MVDKDDVVKEEILKINKKLLEGLENYRKTMAFMFGDAPIEVLCLSKVIEKALISNGCLRVYDLFDRDLVEIEGISHSGIRQLTARLQEFISVG